MGPLNAVDIGACGGSASRAATIDPSLGKSVFRFVPLTGEDGTYRIILKDRANVCNRFLSAFKDCSTNAVGFAPKDLSEGLQRWVFTKVDPSAPPSPPAPTQLPQPPPAGAPSPPSPSAPVTSPPAPSIRASDVSYSYASIVISYPYPTSSIICTVTVSPGGKAQSVRLSNGTSTTYFTGLSYSSQYTATAACRFDDGQDLPDVEIAFRTLGGPYTAAPNDSGCDGFGEISSPQGICVCDTENGFISNSNGGCTCSPGKMINENWNACIEMCPDQQILVDGQCVCNAEKKFVDDGQGGCVCDADNNFVDDGQSGCECDAENNYVDDGAGGCQCSAGCDSETIRLYFGTDSPYVDTRLAYCTYNGSSLTDCNYLSLGDGTGASGDVPIDIVFDPTSKKVGTAAKENFDWDYSREGGAWFCDADLACDLIPGSTNELGDRVAAIMMVGGNIIVGNENYGTEANFVYNCDASSCSKMGEWPSDGEVVGMAYAPDLSTLFALFITTSPQRYTIIKCPNFNPTAATYAFGNCAEVPGADDVLTFHESIIYHNGYLYISDLTSKMLHACDPTTSPLECTTFQDNGIAPLGIDAMDYSETVAIVMFVDTYANDPIVQCMHDKVAKTIGNCEPVLGLNQTVLDSDVRFVAFGN